MREAVPDRLNDMLTRLKLTAIRDQLDGLLDEAGRQELSLRETLVLLCERQITRKDARRFEMTLKLARFHSCAISRASTSRSSRRPSVTFSA